MAESVYELLRKPFPVNDLKWRVGNTYERQGSKMANMLVYIDARTVQDRLDEIFTPAGWQFETRSIESYNRGNRTVTIIGRLGIRINDEWIWKEDGAENSDIEAAKGGISDAFKRAAVQWGIGRYLYDASDFNTSVPFTSNFTCYSDNKRALDTIAFKLTLKALDKYGHNAMNSYILSLKTPEQVKFISNLNREMFGNKYDTIAKELLDKMEA